MKRRLFIASASLLTAPLGLLFPRPAFAGGVNAAAPAHPFCLDFAGITGISMGFMEVRHQHVFQIPLSVLANPPLAGFTARTSTPLEGWTDFEGLRHRKDAQGNPLDVSRHSHEVTITQEQLLSLARGRHLTIELPRVGHRLYFVANDATVAALAAP